MPTEPTGLEHLTPVKITSTSATERGVFRKCRRQGDIVTPPRIRATLDGIRPTEGVH